jgi:phenylacetate-CoA ligase
MQIVTYVVEYRSCGFTMRRAWQVSASEGVDTGMISNLANRVQPILRDDLGDSVFKRPVHCTCGNPLPAIRVQGRVADVLSFLSTGEKQVTLPPLAFGRLIDGAPGIERVQIVQTAPDYVRIRLHLSAV